MQAGRIAVPLSVPMGGATDERVSSVLQDASPSVILTTSSVVADRRRVRPAAARRIRTIGHRGRLAGRSIVGTDRRVSGDESPEHRRICSTRPGRPVRQPASWSRTENIRANFEQLMSDYFADYGKVPPPDTTVVSWLPFYHDMGLYLGIVLPLLGGLHAVLTSPVSFLQRPARWMQLLASNQSRVLGSDRTSLSNWRCGEHPTTTWPGLISGTCCASLSGSERVHPRRCGASPSGSPASIFATAVIRPSYGLAEATVYVATRAPAQPPEIVRFESEKLSAGHAKRCEAAGGTRAGQLRHAAVTDGAHRRSRDLHRVSGGNGR